MTVLLGKLLLLAGCAMLGVGKALTLRRRTACLSELRGAIELLERELAFSLPAVSELLACLEKGARGVLGSFFSACGEEFRASGEESLADSWDQALEEAVLPLTGEDLAMLRETGRVLGRYDGDSQRRALAEIRARVNEAVLRAREEEQRLFRVYVALGVTAGAFCAILL